MRVLRAIAALLICLCVVPVVVFILAWRVAVVVSCEIAFKSDTVCHVGSLKLDWLIDRLTDFGVFGTITSGLAVYIFAGWVFVELGVIVFRR
jgi:hypothetical protein